MNEFNKHGTFPEGGTAPPLLHPAQKATDGPLGAQVQPPKNRGVPLRTQDLGRKQLITHSLGEDLLASVGTSRVLSYWMVGGPGCDTSHMPLVLNAGYKPTVLQGIQGRDAIGIWHIHPQCLPRPWLVARFLEESPDQVGYWEWG